MNCMNNMVLQSALNAFTDKGIFIIVTSKKQKPLMKAYTEFTISLEFRTKKHVETVVSRSTVANTAIEGFEEEKLWHSLGITFLGAVLLMISTGDFQKNYGYIQ